ENAISVARKFLRRFQDAPCPWMNVHRFVIRVEVHARDLAFEIVKTHQSMHLRDRKKCRFDRTLQICSVSPKRLNCNERAEQWPTPRNLDLRIRFIFESAVFKGDLKKCEKTLPSLVIVTATKSAPVVFFNTPFHFKW